MANAWLSRVVVDASSKGHSHPTCLGATDSCLYAIQFLFGNHKQVSTSCYSSNDDSHHGSILIIPFHHVFVFCNGKPRAIMNIHTHMRTRGWEYHMSIKERSYRVYLFLCSSIAKNECHYAHSLCFFVIQFDHSCFHLFGKYNVREP